MTKQNLSPWLLTAEEKIKEAMEAGEFSNLPGRGQPLNLEDDAHVPSELRMTYRMLKRANVPTEEIFMKREILDLRNRLADGSHLTTDKRIKLKKRLSSIDLEFNIRLERYRRLHGGI